MMRIGTLGYLSVGISSPIFTMFCLALYSHYIRKYRPRWFRKYNFLLSAEKKYLRLISIYTLLFRTRRVILIIARG
jgi:hypothetical protein